MKIVASVTNEHRCKSYIANNGPALLTTLISAEAVTSHTHHLDRAHTLLTSIRSKRVGNYVLHYHVSLAFLYLMELCFFFTCLLVCLIRLFGFYTLWDPLPW